MKTKPILFSDAMVRAILEGRKTQTRRVVKGLQVAADVIDAFTAADPSGFIAFDRANVPLQCVHSPFGEQGDRLYVRETWAVVPQITDNGPKHKAKGDGTGATWRADWNGNPSGFKWKPSIHMPRWASRLTLEITGLRVERLQQITNEDCVAEGIAASGKAVRLSHGSYAQAGRYEHRASTVRQLYSELWTEINGPGAWASNPWVWVVEFKVVERAPE